MKKTIGPFGVANKEYITVDNEPIKHPKESGWECWMFGSSPDTGGMCWKPSEGGVPNWFHRWMQRLLIGNRWRRIS